MASRPITPPAITTQTLFDIATATRIESIENIRFSSSSRTTVDQYGDSPKMGRAAGAAEDASSPPRPEKWS